VRAQRKEGGVETQSEVAASPTASESLGARARAGGDTRRLRDQRDALASHTARACDRA
jgi:hypothetical protein